MVTIHWKRLDPTAHAPTQGHAGDAGWDLYALQAVVLRADEPPQKIPTWLALQLPPGYAAWVVGRSGLTLLGFTVHTGLVDPHYRGEIGVMASVTGMAEVQIDAGSRIAQLVLFPVTDARWVSVEALEETTRGAAGFGSTGL